jgi:hypothetical protein
MMENIEHKTITIVNGNIIEDSEDTFNIIVKGVFKDRVQLKIITTGIAEELFTIADTNLFDLFIITLNNLNYSYSYNSRDPFSLIRALNVFYQKPIFVLSGPHFKGYPTEQLIASGASEHLVLPFSPIKFANAFARCTDLEEIELPND